MSKPDAPGFDRLRKGLVGSLLVVVVLLVSLLYLGEEGWVVLGAMLLGLMAYALAHILFRLFLQGTRRNVVRPDHRLVTLCKAFPSAMECTDVVVHHLVYQHRRREYAHVIDAQVLRLLMQSFR